MSKRFLNHQQATALVLTVCVLLFNSHNSMAGPAELTAKLARLMMNESNSAHPEIPVAPEPYRMENILFAMGSNGCIDCLYFRVPGKDRIAMLRSPNSDFSKGQIIPPMPIKLFGLPRESKLGEENFKKISSRGIIKPKYFYTKQQNAMLQEFNLRKKPLPGDKLLQLMMTWKTVTDPLTGYIIKRQAMLKFDRILTIPVIHYQNALFHEVVLNTQSDIDRIYQQLNYRAPTYTVEQRKLRFSDTVSVRLFNATSADTDTSSD